MAIRIISGTLKGTKLLSPGSNTTRPTSDRLREAIFNILRLHLQNADILDLFAGTGAMGIEALSRGGKYAIFMEKDKGAAMVIDKNIRRCRLGEKSAIIKRNVLSGLGFIKSLKNSFDLIFMDPPYNMELIKPALQNLCKNSLLKKEGFIVIEHSPMEPVPQGIKGLKLFDQRKYGSTMVSFVIRN